MRISRPDTIYGFVDYSEDGGLIVNSGPLSAALHAFILKPSAISTDIKMQFPLAKL